MFVKEVLQQKTIGCVMVAGITIFCCSGGLMVPLGYGGVFRGTYTREPVTNKITDAGTLNLVPLLFTFMVLGVVLLLGGLGYGLWIVKNESSGPRRVVENFRVVARYAYDKNGFHLMDDGQIEFAEGPRFYVRGMTPDGVRLEYESSEAVWRQAGEGMTGEVELQGKWIGRFTPYIGEAPPA
jgi:hypothetical protein